MAQKSTEADAIDIHIGHRTMARRVELGITQKALAMAMGVSFQQVQKYEKGVNRISASGLWNAAQLLSVDANYFYKGLGDSVSDTTDFPTRHTAAIAELAPQLSVKSQRLVEGLLREMLLPAD